MIACAWVQFMIHDWNDHMEDTEQVPTFCINKGMKEFITCCNNWQKLVGDHFLLSNLPESVFNLLYEDIMLFDC